MRTVWIHLNSYRHSNVHMHIYNFFIIMSALYMYYCSLSGAKKLSAYAKILRLQKLNLEKRNKNLENELISIRNRLMQVELATHTFLTETQIETVMEASTLSEYLLLYFSLFYRLMVLTCTSFL